MYDTNAYEHAPRILLLDIETTPNIVYTWGKWKQNAIDFVETSHVLSMAYKWFGEEEVQILAQPQFARSYKRNRKDDRQLAEAIWALLDEADIVVAHNGDKFDLRKLNGRFFVHGLGRPSPYQTVDTKKVSATNFMLYSNSLNDLAKELGFGKKLPHTGKDLWLDCMAGDPEAWDLMMRYNIHDVELLETLYTRLRYEGWITRHPSMASISGRNSVCPTCGCSPDWESRGYHTTNAYRYRTWRCKNCNSYHRSYAADQGTRTSKRPV